MKKIQVTGRAPRKNRRALELFSAQFNYQPKVIPLKTTYNRKSKHRLRDML